MTLQNAFKPKVSLFLYTITGAGGRVTANPGKKPMLGNRLRIFMPQSAIL